MPADVRTSQIPTDELTRGLLSASADCIAVMDLDGRILRANAAAEAEGLHAVDQSTVAGWAEWWPPETRSAADSTLRAAQRDGIGTMEAQRGEKPGGLRTWTATVTPLHQLDGTVSHLLAVCRDITERREAQAAHASMKRRLDALVAATGEVVWQADGFQLNGIRRGERSRHLSGLAGTRNWLDTLHPDDRNAAEERVRHGITTATAYVNEYRVCDDTGAWRWVQDSAVPVTDENGIVAEWIGVVSDIHERKTVEKALRDSEERLRLAVSASGIGVWDADLVTGAREWSPQLKAIFGLPADMQGSEALLFSLVHPDDRAIVEMTHTDLYLKSEPSRGVNYRIIRGNDAQIRWIASYGRAVLDGSGRPIRLLGTVKDITERKQAEAGRQASAWYLREALRSGRMVVWERDGSTGIVTRSEDAEEILGNTTEHQSEFLKRVHADDRGQATWDFSQQPQAPHPGSVQFRYRHPAGRDLWLETTAVRVLDANTPGSAFGITTDITAKKLAEANLRHAASHDPLTGLLNRMAFGEKLDEAMAAAASQGDPLHLLLMDLDDLKGINDGLGHDAGDAILRSTGETLTKLEPACSFVARLSGDEFAAVLLGDHSPGEVSEISDRLIRLVAEPIHYKHRSISVGASVGIAAFPDHATTSRDLIKNADLALYSSKRAGRGRSQMFRPSMRAAVEAVNSLKAEFREALAANQIVPFYQPKVDLATGALAGFEALARWSHPERGLITPAVFFPVFEDGSLALEIGAVMLDRVLRDVRAWLERGLPVGRIALNCTSHEFRLGDFAELVLQKLQAAGIPTRHFEIEVTEGVVLSRDSGTITQMLRRLHQAGVKISLDDFGTGYASLVHLKMFPVDEIKIDKSFVWEIDDPTNLAIVKAVVAMGHSLGLTIVAEGIETAAQGAALLAIGCDQAQGYWFGKPMHAERVPWFVQNNLKALDRPVEPLRTIIAG